MCGLLKTCPLAVSSPRRKTAASPFMRAAASDVRPMRSLRAVRLADFTSPLLRGRISRKGVPNRNVNEGDRTEKLNPPEGVQRTRDSTGPDSQTRPPGPSPSLTRRAAEPKFETAFDLTSSVWPPRQRSSGYLRQLRPWCSCRRSCRPSQSRTSSAWRSPSGSGRSPCRRRS